MFEQATLSRGPAGARAWTAFLGFTTQVALVSFAVLVPMVWPQVLPTARILETLTPPVPLAPPPKALGSEMRKMPARPNVYRPVFNGHTLIMPTHVPTSPIPVIQDDPVGFVTGGLPFSTGGGGTGVPGGLPLIVGTVVPVMPPRIPVPVAIKPPEPASVIHRYREGGRVALGALLHRAEPPYPAIAKTARVSGVVELECVVGVDGRVQEVKVKSGNPLLIRAAVDAAWQWVYAPSKLNGDPIEIVTNLTFTFKLN
jgi:protein TonB